MNSIFKSDYYRIKGKNVRFLSLLVDIVHCQEIRYLYFYRNQNRTFLDRIIFKYLSKKDGLEIFSTCIGSGLYIGHPFCITINPKVIIGKNCNIHKGVTIGQENRGKRKGVPKIGNRVWIGVNSTIVGNIIIGDDVLIAPNTYINCDIPSHSIVFGNPCQIKHSDVATKDYINNII